MLVFIGARISILCNHFFFVHQSVLVNAYLDRAGCFTLGSGWSQPLALAVLMENGYNTEAAWNTLRLIPQQQLDTRNPSNAI